MILIVCAVAAMTVFLIGVFHLIDFMFGVGEFKDTDFDTLKFRETKRNEGDENV